MFTLAWAIFQHTAQSLWIICTYFASRDFAGLEFTSYISYWSDLPNILLYWFTFLCRHDAFFILLNRYCQLIQWLHLVYTVYLMFILLSDILMVFILLFVQTIVRESSEPFDFVRTSRMAGYGIVILGPSLQFCVVERSCWNFSKGYY